MQNVQAGTYQFDLKESVHLSNEQIPIEEIDDMELVPQVNIEEKGEEIDISGSLYLYGNYRGNLNTGKLETTESQANTYEESVQFEPLSTERGPYSPLAREDKFEYRIPVRINIPKGKVQDISDVYAYISSFDYELMNPYQIDILASLVIAGFREEEERSETEEGLIGSEFEFVHVAGEDSINPVEEAIEQRLKALEEQIASLEEEPMEVTPEPVQVSAVQVMEDERVEEEEEESMEAEEPEEIEELEEPEEDAVEEEAGVNEPQEEMESVPHHEAPPEIGNVIPMPNLNLIETPSEQEEEIVEPEKEVKIAISKKGIKRDREKITSISSMFSKTKTEEIMGEDKGGDSGEIAEGLKDNDAMYLTNFMGEKEERFIKFKLCIIQKNETLEEIAERYRLQVESILKANKATRTQISAGQILYIPVKG
ncbi:MAG TPA: LysM peptidoglycan-binding domain-containing protein [Bacillota bacterium]|nr:LysM peptidoglycan-binding domain-containing protein [Bacillota bacterium]